MQLKIVKPARTLHWPPGLASSDNTFRGDPGYVVDFDAPLEREWCAGQEHKFDDAPAGSVASAITNHRALRALQKLTEAPEAEPKPAATDMPAVDLPKNRRAAKVA